MIVEREISIHAEPAAVWAVLSDVERWPDWTASMTSVRRLDDGPLAVGSRAHVEQPKLRPAVWTVTELEPDRSFTWQSASAGVTTVGGHQLAPGESGTTVVRLSFTMSGVLAPVIGLLLGGRVREYVQLEADGLKRACESV